MKINIFPASAILLLTFVFGCTTTNGTLFNAVHESAGASTPTTEKTQSVSNVQVSAAQQTKGKTVLELHTSPEGAEIYLDYVYSGKTPKVIEGLRPGTYYFSLRKSGYYPAEGWIQVRENEHTVISISLTLITGYLSLTMNPSDSLVLLDGERINGGVSELPVGDYALSVRRFGYEEKTFRISIRERQTTYISADLEVAPFRISEISVSRKRFNPYNPGTLGRLTATFEVSAPGTGSVEVIDSSGNEIFSKELGPFRDWRQSFIWNGEDVAGKKVNEGTYTIRFTGTGSGSEEILQSEVSIVVDTDAVIRFATSLSGASGLLFAPTPETLPSGSFQFSTLLFGHYDTAANTFLLPWQFYLRLSPTDRLAIDGLGVIIFDNDGTSNGLVSGSVKYRLTDPRFPVIQAAVDIRGTLSSLPDIDTFTAFTGGAIGVPVHLTFGPVGIVLSPEIMISPFRVQYSGEGGTSGPYIWGYARSGIFLDFGFLRTGISAAFRTVPFSEGFAFEMPFQAGYEFHILMPETPLFFSFILTGEFRDTDDFYLSAGGGLGFLY